MTIHLRWSSFTKKRERDLSEDRRKDGLTYRTEQVMLSPSPEGKKETSDINQVKPTSINKKFIPHYWTWIILLHIY